MDETKIKPKDLVFNHIKTIGEPVKFNGLKDLLKLTAGQTAGAIHQLVKDGKIKKIERGIYGVV